MVPLELRACKSATPARKPLAKAVAIPEDVGAYQGSMDIGCEGGYCMT